METFQDSSPPSENNSVSSFNNNSFGLYMYQTSAVLENLDRNFNLLSQNVQELSKYNFQSYHNLKSEHDSLSRENKKLKRKYDQLEYELQGYQDWEQEKNENNPKKNEKKYVFRKNKDSYSSEKINDIKSSLHGIEDVIRLESQFREIRHDGDLVRLYYCIDSLRELQNMIGMKDVKEQIFKHLIYYIKNRKNEHMLHTVITGPPGTIGKYSW